MEMITGGSYRNSNYNSNYNSALHKDPLNHLLFVTYAGKLMGVNLNEYYSMHIFNLNLFGAIDPATTKLVDVLNKNMISLISVCIMNAIS